MPIARAPSRDVRGGWRFRRLRIALLGTGLLWAGPGAADEPLDCVIEPHQLVDVSSSEFGVIGRVHVDKADRVEKGDTLAELQTEVEEAALRLSRARASATGELELLRRTFEFNTRLRQRNEALHSKRAVSSQVLDEVRTEEDLSRLRVKQVAEKNEVARLQAERDALALARRIIRSPISGVVVQRFKTAGEYVEGDPIVQVAQVDPLRVELVVPISLYGQIDVGATARVTPELPIEGDFVATVVAVDPLVDAATATFGVRLMLPNPGHRLPPGLKCTVELASAPEDRDETEDVKSAATEPVEPVMATPPPPAPPPLQSVGSPVVPGGHPAGEGVFADNVGVEEPWPIERPAGDRRSAHN